MLALLIVVVPVAAPIETVVPAPAIFTVVAFVLNNVAVPVAVVVISAPFTAKSPVTTVLALRIVVVPVTAPIVIAVPAPNKLPVVAVVLIRLNVVWLVVISPPRTSRSKSTCKLLFTSVVPVTAPIKIVVAAPNAFTVVALALAKLNVDVLTVKSPPSILTSPSTSRLLLIFVVPVAAPISNDVAAPNAFTVVALALARLNVAVLTVKSPPSILTSPSTSRLLLMLVVPVAAPISIVVAAPAKLTVVAVVFTKLNVG